MPETPYDREPGYARRYRDQRFHSGSGPATDRRERDALRALLVLAGDVPGPWLDVPSGAGRMSEELPGSVVQVDRDPEMVAAAPGEHARACASAHRLPFHEHSFTGALCHRLMQHIPTADERIDILRELARVTRGPIVVSFFDSWSLQHLRRRVRRLFGKHRSGRSAVPRRQFARECQAAGLQIVAVRSLRRFISEQTLALCTRTK